MYTYPDYALTLSVFSLNVTINIRFSFTQFLKEVFLNVALKAMCAGGGLKFIGEFIPSTKLYIR